MSKSEFRNEVIARVEAIDELTDGRIVDMDVWDLSVDNKGEWMARVISVSANHVVSRRSYYLNDEDIVKYLKTETF